MTQVIVEAIHPILCIFFNKHTWLCVCKLNLHIDLIGTINVLRLSSLEKVGGLLTDDECYKLGLQLRLKSRNLDKSCKRFKIDMFKQWRGNRPHNALVTTLIDALGSINKVIIGEIVQKAFDCNTEFNYIYE